MRLPVGRQFAGNDSVVASRKGKVTTGTRRMTGRIYSTLAGLRLDRPWRHPLPRRGGGARRECDSGHLSAMFSVCARMIEWGAFDSYRTGGEGLACEVQLSR